MADINTLRVLELDGGGARGYLSLKFLQRFVELWGIDEADLYKNFDVICGTSVGGIMACSLAYGTTLSELEPFFTVTAKDVFRLDLGGRPSSAYKAILLAADIPFYQSSDPSISGSQNYGHGLLYKTMDDNFSTDTMQSLKANVVVPVYEQDTGRFKLFSNLNYPELDGQNELIRNVALATGAAPAYLPALKIDEGTPLEHTYLDGGIYQNNPAGFGVAFGKSIKPHTKRTCVLSIGTGLGRMGFDENGEPPPPELLKQLDNAPNAFNTLSTIFSLFNIASAGAQESISKSLTITTDYTMNQMYHYRFQPVLDVAQNTELDNTDDAIQSYYELEANNWYDDDIDNISTFIGHLTA